MENNIRWTDNIGNMLFKEVIFEIGGVEAERNWFCDKCQKMHRSTNMVWPHYCLNVDDKEKERICELDKIWNDISKDQSS
jgi:hypothetical protein